MDEKYIKLNPALLSLDSQELETGLLSRVVGQDNAVKQLVRGLQTFRSRLQKPHKPIGVYLFLGPTGSGKTKAVEALAECLFGSATALLKIDCGEFQFDHDIAKIIGSPPGYLGHTSTPPRISNAILQKYWLPNLKMSILLFDEIEKASSGFLMLLLGILDKGELTLGNNELVDLTNTLIIMTSNAGSSDIQQHLNGSIGFDTETELSHSDMWERVKHSLKKQFPPEFLNRIDRSIMFHFLDDASLIKITEIELGLVQNRILSAGIFLILQITDAAKAYIRSKGTDPVSGARELDRVIERVLVEPISNLMAAQQVSNRDMLIVDWKEGNELTFHKLEGAVEPPPPPEYIEHAEEVPSTV